MIDLALWLIGPVRRVSATLAPVLPDARLDGVATLQLGFDPPTIGTLVASWILAGGFPGIRIRVHGAKGLEAPVVFLVVFSQQQNRFSMLDRTYW